MIAACPQPRSGHVRPYRPFSEAEKAMVRERYPTEGAIPLAEAMSRKREDIVSAAQRLGVRFNGLRRWTVAEDAQLVALRRQTPPMPVPQIAKLLDRTEHAIVSRFDQLGLVGRRPDREGRRKGYLRIRPVTKNMVESRWARARIALGEHGWHPDLTQKEVAILESLRINGPQSRLNLSLSIGEPPTRPPKKRLMSHGSESSIARIVTRGLVARLFMQDRRRRVVIYTLTESAIKQRGTFGSVIDFNAEAAGRGQTQRKCV